MKSLFFYGTLRYVPLLEIVLGRPFDSLKTHEASLPGHSVHWAQDQAFPLIAKGGSGAKGLLVENLSDEDIARLNFYEGGFDYMLKPVAVFVGSDRFATSVYFPDPGLWQQGDIWELSNWVERWGAMTLHAAREVMSYYGVLKPEDIAEKFGMIRARASAKAYAESHNLAHSPGGYSKTDVAVHNLERPYLDFFAIDEFDLSFRRYDGGQNDMVRRAVFIATDAVIVLPYDPKRDRVLLIEQFRPGPFARGDALPWQLEPIAGRVDAGETPEQTAHREAEEEAGLSLTALHEVAHCYASPGCSTEYYHIFIGIADLPDESEGVAGLESEAEDIRSYLYDFEQLMEMVDNMNAVNAPLVLAGLWLARHRERLRSGA